MDAMMGLVGAALITRWGYGLLRDTSAVLLDSAPEEKQLDGIRQAIESDADNEVVDLHVWRLGPKDFGAIISLVTHDPKEPEYYKALLESQTQLGHITIEVNRCTEDDCLRGAVDRDRRRW